MNILDRTVTGVNENPTIHGSLTRLLHNIAAEIRTTAGNQDASLSLADLVAREAEHLTKSVVAGTPMILATPPLHPSAGSAGGAADKLDVTSITGTTDEVSKYKSEGLREVERVENPDGTLTIFYRPVRDKSQEATAHAAYEAAEKKRAEDEARRKAASV